MTVALACSPVAPQSPSGGAARSVFWEPLRRRWQHCLLPPQSPPPSIPLRRANGRGLPAAVPAVSSPASSTRWWPPKFLGESRSEAVLCAWRLYGHSGKSWRGPGQADRRLGQSIVEKRLFVHCCDAICNFKTYTVHSQVTQPPRANVLALCSSMMPLDA